MERRTLLAVALSILVLLIFQSMMAARYPNKGRVPTPDQAVKAAVQQEGAATAPYEEAVIEAALADEILKTVDTDRFVLTFSNVGGSIKRVGLKEFADGETGAPFMLVDIEDPKSYIGAFEMACRSPSKGLMAGRSPPNMPITDGRMAYRSLSSYAIYDIERDGMQITCTHKGADVEVKKVYNFYNSSDYIELEIFIKNTDGIQITFETYLSAGGDLNATGAMASRYAATSAKVNGKIVRDRKDSVRSGDVSWVALNSKYFYIILRPLQLARRAITTTIGKGRLTAGVEGDLHALNPGSEAVQRYLFYLGPVDRDRIKALDMGLEDAVDYGVFGGISRLLLVVLRFFYNIVHNWGFAIICLTVLMNAFLYPLTSKSYRSMRAMQELQPHIDKLRTMHKDNPHKMNKELMELYRQYKVNPLGGCLPLLIQMPIFIALYHALIRHVELKGANFLWIKDLSKPDAVGLPFSLPILGDSINILPIFMMVAMIFQQKVSSVHKPGEMSEQQKQQQQMMMLMPVVFVVIFYTLPSGLVLYWLVNTTLMILHQLHIKRKSSGVLVT